MALYKTHLKKLPCSRSYRVSQLKWLEKCRDGKHNIMCLFKIKNISWKEETWGCSCDVSLGWKKLKMYTRNIFNWVHWVTLSVWNDTHICSQDQYNVDTMLWTSEVLTKTSCSWNRRRAWIYYESRPLGFIFIRKQIIIAITLTELPHLLFVQLVRVGQDFPTKVKIT